MMDAVAGSDEYREWKSWDADRFGDLKPESRRYLELELEQSVIRLSANSHVLEVGFGNGDFASFCRDLGCTYSGTEIDPELVNRAKAAGLDAHVAPDNLVSTFEGRSFDLITCFDVLEHLTQDQIIAMLTAFRSLLAPNGRILARFPSGDSPFSVAMYNGDITHRSWIGRGAVLQYCVATGLEAKQIRQPALPLRGVGLKRMLRRGPIVAARWLIRKFVRTVFYDGQPRVVDPNMVIVLGTRAE